MLRRNDDHTPWDFPLTVDPADARQRLDAVAARSQYGWGQSVRLSDEVEQDGFLGDKWLNIVRTIDEWGWFPGGLDGAVVADVGCFSGAMSLVLASRGARVIAVEEVPEHLDQARLLFELLEVDATPVEASLYDLQEHVEPGSLDLIVLSGVLYHLSDMLTGLIAMQQLLKPGGRLIIQTNAIENFEASYANFGRFYAGWWWQPTALCIQDMCEFAGLDRAEVRFYEPGRCLAVADKPLTATDPEAAVPFKRGVHWGFESLDDSTHRHLDASTLAPAPDPKGDITLTRRWIVEVVGKAARRILRVAAQVKGRASSRRR